MNQPKATDARREKPVEGQTALCVFRELGFSQGKDRFEGTARASVNAGRDIGLVATGLLAGRRGAEKAQGVTATNHFAQGLAQAKPKGMAMIRMMRGRG